MIEPGTRRVAYRAAHPARDPRFFTTYYAIDAVNFHAADMSSALPRLDAPYLPLVVHGGGRHAARSVIRRAEEIMQRCYGLFYRCNGGAEARRFNRLLIDAG